MGTEQYSENHLGWSVMIATKSNWTPDMTMEKVMPLIQQRLDENEFGKINVDQAIAVYRTWGYKDGRATGVLLSGMIYPYQKERLIKCISMLIADVGKSVGVIQFATTLENGDCGYSNIIIQNVYSVSERSVNTLKRSVITEEHCGIHFWIPLIGDGDEDGLNEFAQLLFEQMDTADDGDYVINGVLYQDGDDVYFEGTQNPIIAPDQDAYLDALDKVIDVVGDYIVADYDVDYPPDNW